MMSIEKDSPCDDYLQISETSLKDLTKPTKVYMRACASSVSELPAKQKDFVINAPYVLIHFHSDWIWTDDGFSLKYQIEGGTSATPAPPPVSIPGT